MLSNRLRISRDDARRRLDEADDLGPRTAMTGQPLQPVLPNVATAQAAGKIRAEHVRIIRRFFTDLPTAVDIETRQKCEAPRPESRPSRRRMRYARRPTG